LSAQCFYLGLYKWDLAIVLGDSKNTLDPQPGALGRGSSVSLVQQNPVRREFECKRNSLSFTGIESGCEQPRDLVLSKCLRFDATVLESLLDLLQRCWVRQLVKFRLDSAGNPNLAELASEKTLAGQ